MRYIAIFLVLANLVYFGWNQTHPQGTALQAPESRPLLNNGLMLVSEFEAQSAQQVLENAEATRVCSIVSGFSSIDEANSFMAAARNLSLGALLNLTGEALPSRYRVFLAPASSRGIAIITLEALSERIAKAELEVESYLITRGLLENGIALGVYLTVVEAESAQRVITALGYAPEIEEMFRSEGEIQVWL
ncbi:MAG: hypothetical protein QGF90_11385, partial [Gammaproteobacteria bacterium]|nr:hypothetical protein [Gammaproteobacteria bacterium]